MKAVIAILVVSSLLVSCKDAEQERVTAATAATQLITPVAKEGSGKVILQCGAKTFTVDGKCGGNTVSGDLIVAVQDKSVPSKVFTITFNTKDYPTAKTYTIKKSDFMSEGEKPANEIYVGFSEISNQNKMDWSSNDASGTMQFQVSGNEIRCNFKNIKLQPSMLYNKDGLDQPGTVSGEMTFYKN